MKHSFAYLFLATVPLMGQGPGVLPAGQVDPALRADPGNDMFQRAKNLYDQAKATQSVEQRNQLMGAAAMIFNDYLTNYPRHVNAEQAWLYLGQSLYQTGRVDDGKRCFHTLLNTYGKGIWVGAAAYTLAYDYMERKEYSLAASMFLKFADNTDKEESVVRGHFFAATCYVQLGQDQKAGEYLRKVIDSPANGAFVNQARVALGSLLQRAGKLKEALPLFEAVAGASTTPALRGEAALKAALAATQLGQPELSEKYLKMIAVTPGMEDYRSDAVLALMANAYSKKDYSGVLEAYRKSGLDVTDMTEPAPGETERLGDDKRAERLMLAGRACFQQNLPSEALRLFRQIERLLPAKSDLAFQASYQRLLCFYEIDGAHLPEQVDAFLEIYRKSRPADTSVHSALLMKAESLFAKKDYAKAAPAYAEVDLSLIKEPLRPGVMYNRGRCMVEVGDAAGAIRLFSKLISDYPKDENIARAIAHRAEAYRASGEAVKALEDYDLLIRRKDSPEFVRKSWLESARVCRDQKNYPELIKRYRGLLENPEGLSKGIKSEANFFIGLSLVRTNQTQEGIPYLEQSRKENPEDYGKSAGQALVLGYFNLQNLAKLSEELDLAIRDGYTQQIHEDALRWAGRESYFAGKYEAAVRYLSLVADEDSPQDTPKEVWRYLTKSLLETGKPEEALKTVEHVLKVEDNPLQKADTLYDKARALARLKRDKDAMEILGEAMKTRPEGRVGANIRLLRGETLLRSGEVEEASADFGYVVNFIDDRDLKPLALWRLSQALRKKGDEATATKYENQLVKEFPSWKAPD